MPRIWQRRADGRQTSLLVVERPVRLDSFPGQWHFGIAKCPDRVDLELGDLGKLLLGKAAGMDVNPGHGLAKTERHRGPTEAIIEVAKIVANAIYHVASPFKQVDDSAKSVP